MKTFAPSKENGKWSVVAKPIASYHLPAIIAECENKSAASLLSDCLNKTFEDLRNCTEWREK